VSLDPQAAAYLEQLRALALPPYWEIGPEQARRDMDAGAAALFGEPDAVASQADVDAGGVPARVYVPAGEPRGALVYYHGGGWVLGGLASHGALCQTLAARAGCTVLAVDYRLAPEHPFPAAVDDAWAALRYAAEQHAPLAVGGDSAGGALAASIALRARDAGLPLALQVLVYPVTDCDLETESYREHGEGTNLTTAQMRWFWDQYAPDPASRLGADASPLRAASLAGVAPALVLTAGHDPLRSEGEALAERLEHDRVPVTLHRYAGMVHGFLRMPAIVDAAGEAMLEIAAALRSALGAAPAAVS
jgi:acetyl esterase